MDTTAIQLGCVFFAVALAIAVSKLTSKHPPAGQKSNWFEERMKLYDEHDR